MKAFMLLVTWIVSGQPADSYQVSFTSMEACEVARSAVLKDAERIKGELQRQAGGLKNSNSNIRYTPVPPPLVTAVCAAQ